MADIADFGINVDVNVNGVEKWIQTLQEVGDGTKKVDEAISDLLDNIKKGGITGKQAFDILEQGIKKVEAQAKSTNWEESFSAMLPNMRLQEFRKNLNINAKEFKEAEKEHEKAVKEHEKAVQKKIKADEQAAKSAQKMADKQKQAYKNMLKSAAGFLGSYVAVKKTFSSVMGFAQEGEQLARMADMAGVSSEQIQRLGGALRNYGGSASSASSTLSKLNKQMADLRMGRGGAMAKAIMQYGLNTSARTPEEMLLNIAKRMQGMGAVQQVNFGRTLGLDEPTIMLLQQGVEGVRKELEKAQDSIVFTKEDIENSQKLNRSYREFQDKLKQIKAIITRDLLPYFKDFFDGLVRITKELKEHPKLIKGLGVAATVAFGAIMAVINPFWTILSAIGVAIGALIDDFVVWKQGGESFFDWTEFVEGLKYIKEGLTDLKEWVKQSETIQKIWEGIKVFFEYLGKLIGKLANLIGGIMAAITVLANKGTWKEAWEALKASVADKEEPRFRNDSILQDAFNPATAQIGSNWLQQADAFPLNSIGSGTISNINNAKTTTQTLHIDTLNLQTQAKDGASILGGLQTELSGMVGNMGVATQ